MNIQIPTELNDITLEQYQAFDLINNDEQEQEFKLHKTISIFTEVDMDTVSKFPIKDAEEIAEDIQKVLQKENPFNRFFTLNGIKYGFIPSLEDISLGEYIDLEDGLKDVKQFHKAAAVMFRPIVKSYGDLYTIEPYTATLERMEIMKKAPLGSITAAVVFFCSIVNVLQRVSQLYSKKLLTDSKDILEKTNLPASTDGLTAYSHLVGVISQSITK